MTRGSIVMGTVPPNWGQSPEIEAMVRRGSPVLAVLIGTAGVGCGGGDASGPTSPSSAANVQLVGRVVDERTLQGVPGVSLHWGGGRVGLLQISSVTDATGGYQVQLPDADAYSVSADGAAPFSGVVRPTAALDIVNFYVHTGGCPTEYGRIVVNSCLTLAIVAGMSVRDLSQNAICNLGWTDIRMPAPVFIGDTLYAESQIVAKRESASRPNAGIVTARTTARKADATVVMTYERAVLVPKRVAARG